MKGKTKQKFYVPELKAKVRTLEAVFGEKFMRTELNPRTVDKWLKEDDPTPYLTSLKKYFKTVGMNESDMIRPGYEFSKKVVDIYSELREGASVQYSMDDVLSIYNSFAGVKKSRSVLLEQTLRTMQIETIKNDYKYLKGSYHMYHYWQSGDPAEAGKVRRNLIEIYDLDGEKGLMNCRIMISPMKDMSRDDWWIYEGWVFNIKNKLFWLFECIKGMLPEIVTFYVFKPSFWPAQDRFVLHGILSALSLEGMPCASNMLLKKISPDDPLKDKIGYFPLEEIEAEGHGVDIKGYINNETEGAFDVLTRTTK